MEGEPTPSGLFSHFSLHHCLLTQGFHSLLRIARQERSLEVNSFKSSLKVGRYRLLCILVLVPGSCLRMSALFTEFVK